VRELAACFGADAVCRTAHRCSSLPPKTRTSGLSDGFLHRWPLATEFVGQSPNAIWIARMQEFIRDPDAASSTRDGWLMLTPYSHDLTMAAIESNSAKNFAKSREVLHCRVGLPAQRLQRCPTPDAMTRLYSRSAAVA
jgi:hypothetical protein